MKRKVFFYIIVVISIGIILLNEVNALKYLTCDEPGEAIVIVEEVTEDEVSVMFITSSSAETFRTFKYHIDGDTLYIGAKYWINPFSSGSGEFNTTIETKTEITTIIQKGGFEEREIYPGS